ncbi:hypothetical protein OXPF_34320 [Oxobacter pfennigii]|uniref:Uncharacterized protein n=1 Tax=Oxobacter pfennigii TaxID=36849 RepID=A0A0P8W341_9CLOT|nr:hypothetical protein OXPF_34320 [Oxobacter pfennigii]
MLSAPTAKRNIMFLDRAALMILQKNPRIGTLSKLPVDPKLSAACDAGTIELFNGSWLVNMIKMIESI